MVQIDIIETPSLGDRSYLLSDGTVAAVIDPQRDIDRILEVAKPGTCGSPTCWKPTSTTTTSAAASNWPPPLARRTCQRRRQGQLRPASVRDGDVVTIGQMRLRAIHTPGHTHHHLSYALQTADGDTQAVFTGGSMLYASTGRTDLLGAGIHRRAHPRPVPLRAAAGPRVARRRRVMPTHGFGSFCSATPTTGEESTIAEQRQVNPALTQEEQAFVDKLIAGLDAYPAYYAHMGPMNAGDPGPGRSLHARPGRRCRAADADRGR